MSKKIGYMINIEKIYGEYKMIYDSLDQALKVKHNGTIYIARSVEAPCGPCDLGACHEILEIYTSKEEALKKIESLFKKHRCDSENYIMELVEAHVQPDGSLVIDENPIRDLPDDKYWEDYGDEFDYDRECWVEMPKDGYEE